MLKKIFNYIKTAVTLTSIITASLLLYKYFKKLQSKKKHKKIDKQTLIKIMTEIRKKVYKLYKKTIPHYHKLNSKSQHHLTTEQFQSYILSDKSPVPFKSQYQSISEIVCNKYHTTYSQFENILPSFIQHPQVQQIYQLNVKQHQLLLAGQIVQLSDFPPRDIPAQKLLQIQNRIIKCKYVFQIQLLKRLKGKNGKELMDRSLTSGLKQYEYEQQRILQEYGFDDEKQGGVVVYNSAVDLKMKNNRGFREQFENIEQRYKKVFMKYVQQVKKGSKLSVQLEKQIKKL